MCGFVCVLMCMCVFRERSKRTEHFLKRRKNNPRENFK